MTSKLLAWTLVRPESTIGPPGREIWCDYSAEGKGMANKARLGQQHVGSVPLELLIFIGSVG